MLAGLLSKVAFGVGWSWNDNLHFIVTFQSFVIVFYFVFVIQDQVSKDKALQTVANLSSAQIVSASVMKPQTPFPPPVRVRR